jgi:hypothetical protein
MPRGKQTALQPKGAATTLLGSDKATGDLVDVYHEALTRRMDATRDEVKAKTELLARFEAIKVGPEHDRGTYTTEQGRAINVTIAKRKLSFVKAKAKSDEEEASGELGDDDKPAANATH